MNTPASSSVAERVIAARDGDQRAFQSLIEDHEKMMKSEALKILKKPRGNWQSDDEAEDCVQITALYVWQHLADCDPESFSGWLKTIIHSRAIDRARELTKQSAHENHYQSDEEDPDHSSQDRDYEDESNHDAEGKLEWVIDNFGVTESHDNSADTGAAPKKERSGPITEKNIWTRKMNGGNLKVRMKYREGCPPRRWASWTDGGMKYQDTTRAEEEEKEQAAGYAADLEWDEDAEAKRVPKVELDQGLLSLPPVQNKVVWMSRDGFSISQIAAKLGMTENAVKSARHKAKNKLVSAIPRVAQGG